MVPPRPAASPCDVNSTRSHIGRRSRVTFWGWRSVDNGNSGLVPSSQCMEIEDGQSENHARHLPHCISRSCSSPNRERGVGSELRPHESMSRRGKGSQPMGHPPVAKALVYFLQDDSELAGIVGHTNRLGVDGRWVGATHGDSYFYFFVDPGEHHLCASWQKGMLQRPGDYVAEAHFTAEAEGVYYFKAKNLRFSYRHATSGISLGPLDSDEGKLMASKYSFSTFQQKK